MEGFTYVSELPAETIAELKALEEEKLRGEGLDDEAVADALEKFENSKIADIDYDLSEDDGLDIDTEDVDDDGDIDRVEIEKEDPVDNDEVEEPKSEGLSGEMTPEEELMLKLMGGDAPHDTELSGETTPEEEEMLAMFGDDNKTNSIANTLASYRW